MPKFNGKKLLVLGSNIYAPAIVDYARKNDAYVVVADYYPLERSEAKRHANEALDISTADIPQLKDYCCQHKIDGVLCGISEFNILNAMQLSWELGLRFYCNREQWDQVERKDCFRELCHQYDVPCPKVYFSGAVSDLDNITKQNIVYPVVVKPVDCEASSGVSICYDFIQLEKAVIEADSFSKVHKIIIEKFVEGYEFTAHYTICKGKAALSCIDNRYPSAVHEGNVTTIPVGRIYPALFLDEYKAQVNSQMISLCEGLGLEYGVLFAQGFYDSVHNRFSIFEAGLRGAAECPCRFIEQVSGQNYLHMLVDFILLGNSDYDLKREVPNLDGKCGGIISYATKGGTVGQIIGLEETVQSIPSILQYENRYPVGSVTPDGNTLRQLMLRFIMLSESREALKKDVAFLNEHIDVYNTNGNNMVVKFDPQRIDGLK